MSLSALFEVLVAILGVVSIGYLIYAYFEFLKDMVQTEINHRLHHNPPL